MHREFEINKSFELEMFGLFISISVTAAAEVTHESFAYHNGLGDVATAPQVSVEITSLQIHWDEAAVFDDAMNAWPVKVPPAKKDAVKKELMNHLQAYAESKAASFARND